MQAVSAIAPERFGRYILLDRIGEGGMAEVFRAIMPGAEGFKRTLVIKKILGNLSRSPKFVDMFVREARIGALLHHPGIVQVFDFGNVDGHYFLAMEYLRGRDVLAMIRRLRQMKRAFPIAVAAYIAREVASCLAYAHALTDPDGRPLGIVHRDVSPSNVMCLREGGVKLLDFGIASAVSEMGLERTDQGAFKGKLTYMAPERLNNKALDGRADLYSLGVMLWEMLTCKRLFRGDSEAETFRKVLEMPIPPPSVHRPDVPTSLDGIVVRLLERDRAKRYPTGKALADDLEEVLRECDFRSKQLPALLAELFGSGTHSSQVAISCLGPELLAAAGSLEGGSAGTGSASLTPIISRRPKWQLWLAATVAALVAATSLWGIRAVWLARSAVERTPPRASPPIPTTPAVLPPAPRPAPAPVATTAPARPLDVAAPAVAPKVKRALGRRPGKSSAANDIDAIAKGRSINPFAEATRRGH